MTARWQGDHYGLTPKGTGGDGQPSRACPGGPFHCTCPSAEPADDHRENRGNAMRITNADRALAAELVALLAGDSDERDVKCVAIVLAAHRLTEQGRCGNHAPSLVGQLQYVCALPAGHDGWHRGDRDGLGNAAEWSPDAADRKASESA